MFPTLCGVVFMFAKLYVVCWLCLLHTMWCVGYVCYTLGGVLFVCYALCGVLLMFATLYVVCCLCLCIVCHVY